MKKAITFVTIHHVHSSADDKAKSLTPAKVCQPASALVCYWVSKSQVKLLITRRCCHTLCPEATE